MSELSDIREHMIRQSQAVEKLAELTAAGHQSREAARREWDGRLRSIENTVANISGSVRAMQAQFDGLPDKVQALEVKTRDVPAHCQTQDTAIRALERTHWKALGIALVVSALLALVGPKLLDKVLK